MSIFLWGLQIMLLFFMLDTRSKYFCQGISSPHPRGDALSSRRTTTTGSQISYLKWNRMASFPIRQKNMEVTNSNAIKKLDVGTYNVNLFLQHYHESDYVGLMNRIIDQIPKDLDVLGIQEVWEPSSREYLIQRLSDHYPYFHYPEDDSNVLYTCQDRKAATRLLSCFIERNLIPVKEFEELKPCTDFVSNIISTDPNCFACIVAAGFDRVDPAVCLNTPGWSLYAFHGSAGIVLFSKKPFDEIHVKSFPGMATKRAIQIASIDGVRIAHSHFPYFDSGFPALFPDQIHFAQYVISQHPFIIFGDLNSGPGYQSEMAFDVLVRSGYIDVSPGNDTFCPRYHSHTYYKDCQFFSPSNLDHIFVLKEGYQQSFCQIPQNDHDHRYHQFHSAKDWEQRPSFSMVSFQSSLFATEKNQTSDHVGVRSTIHMLRNP